RARPRKQRWSPRSQPPRPARGSTLPRAGARARTDRPTRQAMGGRASLRHSRGAYPRLATARISRLCRLPAREESLVMALSKLLESWPALRQLREGDPLGLGKAVQSPRSQTLVPRIDEAEHVVHSICPYCAVGCGQLVYVKDGDVTHIEGDPASPISRGRLCPKGQASKSYVQSPLREYKVKYRRPYGTQWEELSLDDAMEMIAERIIKTGAD